MHDIPIPASFGTDDPMNAYEYYEKFKPTGWSDPERLLLVGVLEIAILDLTSKVAKHRNCMGQGRTWRDIVSGLLPRPGL